MTSFIPYSKAIINLYQCKNRQQDFLLSVTDKQKILDNFHPDYQQDTTRALKIGVNKGDACPNFLADLIESESIVNNELIKNCKTLTTDILVIGGGGAGISAALSAAQHGRSVLLTTKLHLGDNNTCMAEGGIGAAIGEDDSLQAHFDDTMKASCYKANPQLVKTLVEQGPSTIHWLINQGIKFDSNRDNPAKLMRKKPGGGTFARILSCKDYTGLEIMRVLKEATLLNSHIQILELHPVLELLTDEQKNIAGAVLYDIVRQEFIIVKSSAVILATGGSGRLHFNDFPTSNHYGSTADGLIIAYRACAKLKDIGSFQYHPTGLASPSHLKGTLISEAARSYGAHLINGLGERFVDELETRDVVSASILKECKEGRGIQQNGNIGVFLDVSVALEKHDNLLKTNLVSLSKLAKKCSINLLQEPLIVFPTLHYQNGGIAINEFAESSVKNLYCPGEISGGVHGFNRMMGNALLDIIVFGRIAGNHAAINIKAQNSSKIGLFHLDSWKKDLSIIKPNLKQHSPLLFPSYSNFNLFKKYNGS